MMRFLIECSIQSLLGRKSENLVGVAAVGLFLFGKFELLPNADEEAFFGPQKPKGRSRKLPCAGNFEVGT